LLNSLAAPKQETWKATIQTARHLELKIEN